MKIEKKLLDFFDDKESILEDCRSLYSSRIGRTKSKSKANTSVKAFLIKEIVKMNSAKNSTKQKELEEAFLVKDQYKILVDNEKIENDSCFIINEKIKNCSDEFCIELLKEAVEKYSINILDYEYFAVAEI